MPADPSLWTNDALFQPETRARFRALLDLGFVDAVRACNDQAGVYTFWDYQAGAFQRNNGIRIDHLLLSPQAQDKLQSAAIREGRPRLGEAVGPCAGDGGSQYRRVRTRTVEKMHARPGPNATTEDRGRAGRHIGDGRQFCVTR